MSALKETTINVGKQCRYSSSPFYLYIQLLQHICSVKMTKTHKNIILLLAIVNLMIFTGCARSPYETASYDYLNGDETRVLSVPFVKQKKSQCCGRASLIMVLKYWGASVEIINKAASVDCPPNGFSGKELKELAINSKMQSFIYRGSIFDLQENLLATRPLIVMIGEEDYRHYVVVCGSGDGNKLILINPNIGYIKTELEDFMTSWRKAHYFTMLVVPETNL